jgi:hypothetical protein
MFTFLLQQIGCSFKCLLKVGVEKSIVNARRTVKTQTTQKLRSDLNS